MRKYRKWESLPFNSLINEKWYKIKLLAKYTGNILLVKYLGKYLTFSILFLSFIVFVGVRMGETRKGEKG